MSNSDTLYVYRYNGPSDLFIRANDYGEGRVERGGEIEMADAEVARAARYGHQFEYVGPVDDDEEEGEAPEAELSDDGEGDNENTESAEFSEIISTWRDTE